MQPRGAEKFCSLLSSWENCDRHFLFVCACVQRQVLDTKYQWADGVGNSGGVTHHLLSELVPMLKIG